MSPRFSAPHAEPECTLPSSECFQQLFESGPEALMLVDTSGVIQLATANVERYYGARERLLRRRLEDVCPDLFRGASAEVMEAALAGGQPAALPRHPVRADCICRVRVQPMAQGTALFLTDITEVLVRERRQEAIARFGLRCLHTRPLEDLVDDAVDTVEQALGVGQVRLLEYLPAERAVVVRAVRAPSATPPRQLRFPAEPGTMAGYALEQPLPLLVADLATEDRFHAPESLLAAGLRSTLTVVVAGNGVPFGFLGVGAPRPGAFTLEDAGFLQAVASILAGAIARSRTEQAVRESERDLRVILDNLFAFVGVLAPDGTLLRVNRAALEAIGCASEDVVGKPFPETPWWAFDREVQMSIRSAIVRAGKGETVRFDAPHRTFDGRDIVVDFMLAPVRNAGGAVTHLIASSIDITPRVRAEAALRSSEDRLLHAMQAGGMIAYDGDLRTGLCHLSSTAPNVVGPIPPGEAILIKDMMRLIHPDDFPRIKATSAAALVRGGEYVFHYRVTRRDTGEIVWVEDRGVVDLDAAGQPATLRGVVIDVSRQRRAEERLRASEERFRGLVENGAVGFAICEAAGGMSYANEALLDLLGFTREEVDAGKVSWLALTPPEYRPADQAALAELHQRGRCAPYEKVYIAKDGTRIPLLVGATVLNPAPDGGIDDRTLLGVFYVDLSEQKAAEEALKESESRLRKLIEASFDGVAIARDGRVMEANRGLAEMFGYDPDEVAGMAITDFVAEESLPYVRGRLAGDIDGRISLVGRRKDGSSIHLEATSRIHPVDGRPGRLIALRDVSERRSLEEQFLQAQKMEAIGRLAGGVAHDFNNMLTAIGSYTELLLNEVRDGDPMRGDLEEIRKAGDRAAALTRQLLAFSRRQLLMPRRLQLNDVVGGLEGMLRRLVSEDIALEVELADDLRPVRADPGQLEQVVLNLLVNARDAMPQGGTVRIRTANAELSQSDLDGEEDVRPGSYVALSISDTGTGIPPEVLPRIFEPFFTTKESGKGTGLGLSTVYGIVKQSGGHIAVASHPGTTTFTVYLPHLLDAVEPEIPLEPATAVGAMRRGREHILFVEDEEHLRTVARRILERQGYRVTMAANGLEALGYCRRSGVPVDLLMTDVVMPEMGGLELVETLAGEGIRPRVVFMSGYSEDWAIQGMELTAGVRYLEKPFTVQGILHVVAATLDKTVTGA